MVDTIKFCPVCEGLVLDGQCAACGYRARNTNTVLIALLQRIARLEHRVADLESDMRDFDDNAATQEER